MPNLVRLAAVILSLSSWSLAALPAVASGAIPFIGCPNILGEKPTGKPITLDLPENLTSQLALYVGAYMEVLAPRGWTCSANYGNVNGSLWVYPPSSNPATGPVVAEWYVVTGFGGGRENGPIYGGRYFPKIYSDKFVNNALQEENATFGTKLTKEQFLAPKYADDKIIYLSNSALEYWTPPDRAGLGSDVVNAATLTPRTISTLPTAGFLKMAPANSDGVMVQMAARVPAELARLQPSILKFSKDCLLAQDSSPDMAPCGSDVDYDSVGN
jgi:hypothetical protein